jgi:hypothetical protein
VVEWFLDGIFELQKSISSDDQIDWIRWHAIARNGTMDQSTFQEGQAFRDFLASAFRENKDVLVSPMTNDGSVLCMLNLVASQQVLLRFI